MKYKNIIFDIDSTLVAIEGIDELARVNGVYDAVRQLTADAMNGALSFGAVFQKRLALIRPKLSDITHLQKLYRDTTVPEAKECINWLHRNGYRVFIVTGGYLQALYPLVDSLGIPRDRVFANQLFFDENGEYEKFDQESPLWKASGKRDVIQKIRRSFSGGTVCIGDGVTDYVGSLATDAFWYFGGVTLRKSVAQHADIVIVSSSLMEVVHILRHCF